MIHAVPLPANPNLFSKKRSDPAGGDLLNPWPKPSWKFNFTIAVIILLYIWGIVGTNASVSELVIGLPHLWRFIAGLFPPDFDIQYVSLAVPGFFPFIQSASMAFPYPEVIPWTVETIQMALIGTTIGVVLSIPFGLLAARNTSPHLSVYYTTRMLLNTNRAIPEIIFALIFVSALGLGPFAGVFALAIGSVGSLGKIFAEAIESIDPQQVLAVQATGANRLLVFLYGVMPQALPVMASYSLLYFEHNVRSATILGIVGAGGIGYKIHEYLQLFQLKKLMGAIIILVLTVTLLDRISDSLRKKII